MPPKGKKCCQFNVAMGSEKIHFIVKVKSSFGEDNCLRIARLCWLRLKAGDTVENMRTYRDLLYELCQACRIHNALAEVAQRQHQQQSGEWPASSP